VLSQSDLLTLRILKIYEVAEGKGEDCTVRASPNIIRVIKSRRRWTGHVARIGEMKIAWNIAVGKPEGKRPLGRPRHRWEEVLGWEGVDRLHLAQDRNLWRALVNTVMNLVVP
jgi:hypothetical protein